LQQSHYVFDLWMRREHPGKPYCHYADDGLVHCKSEWEAYYMLEKLRKRFSECGLQIHLEKTKIIYCKDEKRKGKYPNTSFDFLGYTFRGRIVRNTKTNKIFVSFTPAVSKASLKSMRAKTKCLNWRNRTDLSLNEIARRYNPVLRGWLTYYGRYCCSAMDPMWRHFNKTLVAWAMHKYKHYGGHKTRAVKFMERIAAKEPYLFVHWKSGMRGAFA